MKLYIGILSFLISCIPLTVSAQYYFEYSNDIQHIYAQIIALDIEEAELSIETIKNKDPFNLCILHMENYVDFFRVFLGEDIQEFESLEKNKKIRLHKLDKGSKASPYYRFIKAEIILQWALMRIKFDEKWTAFFEINKALGLLQENEEHFPNFIENKKSLSLLHALIGTIPASYTDILSFFTNFEGSIEKGSKEIDDVLKLAEGNSDFVFFEESIIIKTFIMAHLQNKPSAALQLIHKTDFSSTIGPLHSYTMALLYHKSGDNNKAIDILEEAMEYGHGEKLTFLYFMLGHYKLCRLDSDANIYLNHYVLNFKGRHYIKEAWQKLAWHAISTQADAVQYLVILEKCSNNGFTLTEEDKQAQSEAKRKLIPNAALLKSRLLFDGAYYNRAAEELQNAIRKNQIEDEKLLFYYYRMARIYHKQNKLDDAIKTYQTVIGMDHTQRLYQSCNSNLQIGIIYESLGNKPLAKQHFQHCLNTSPDEYERSLHQKAKAGLNRISTIK